MKFLEIWVSTPLARALGWTLLHSLWEGAAVAGALACAFAAFRSSRTRYVAACTALLALLAGVALTFVRLMPDGMGGLGAGPAPALPPWNVTAYAQTAPAAGGSLAALVPWLAPLWIVGVWIFVLAQVGAWLSVSRMRRRGVCCASDRWEKELTRLRARLRVSRPVRLLESCRAGVPVVIGHIRPLILMPVGLLAGLPAGQVEAILLHELAHIRRHDYLINFLQRCVESLLFYNPAVWWISRVIRTERENCCDDLVVATSGNVQEYAAALSFLEENRWPRREPAMAASGGNLVKRIRRLLNPAPATFVWTPLLAAALFATTAAVGFAAWPAPAHRQSSAAEQEETRLDQQQEKARSDEQEEKARLDEQQQRARSDEQEEKARLDEQQTKVRDENSPFEKWLNQDVVYIITPQERAAFEKLTSDEERKKFVEQFWERRNPHPGSSVNTYKQQYYHRLAYANQHFGIAGKPGWQTDRGHMLVLYGPPDEIDAHAEAKPPYEEWMYRHIDGLGDNVTLTFIDRSGEGDYQLAPGPVNNAPAKKQSSQSDLPVSGKNGYSYPRCLYCPQPQYSQEALTHKFEGVAELTATITPDGHAQDIQVTKELPYGLTDKAIEAVRQWRFRPADGPDGQPAAVRQTIEVVFHLYGSNGNPAGKSGSTNLELPTAGRNGYSYPRCLYCPQIQYTDDAVEHKFQGTATFTMVVRADGLPEDVKLTQGPFPYGLEASAVETLNKWRFQPATGPDGKPAAVRQIVRVALHLF